jgi:hypothetical protein
MPDRAIFLNGPPRSGKDTLALHLKRTLPGVQVHKFARVLKLATHRLYGLLGGPMEDDAFFEACKDEPRPEFRGLSPRQAYIAVSERYMKPTHGEDVFGRMLVENLGRTGRALFVISDSGFAAEALPVVREIGARNCLLLRIHADRRGCDFHGDSRSHITLPEVRTVDLDNQVEGAEAAFLRSAERVVRLWLQRRPIRASTR